MVYFFIWNRSIIEIDGVEPITVVILSFWHPKTYRVRNCGFVNMINFVSCS